MSLLGKQGVREVALRSRHATAEYLKAGLRARGRGHRLAFPEAPTYNEFLLLHDDPDGLLGALTGRGILGGVPPTRFGAGLTEWLLVAATEKQHAGRSAIGCSPRSPEARMSAERTLRSASR